MALPSALAALVIDVLVSSKHLSRILLWILLMKGCRLPLLPCICTSPDCSRDDSKWYLSWEWCKLRMGDGASHPHTLRVTRVLHTRPSRDVDARQPSFSECGASPNMFGVNVIARLSRPTNRLRRPATSKRLDQVIGGATCVY